MLPTILATLAGLLLLLILFIASRPSDFRIERSITIAGPPHAVYPLVNDLHQWDAWSPWAKLDPEMKITHTGPPQGEGASYTWTGNKKVGEGRMTILKSQPGKSVTLRLEFIKPFTATNTTEFTFTPQAGTPQAGTPQGNSTLVNWAMTGRKNFIMKAFGLLMNMDKMVGKDFEKGLAAMKTVAES